MSLKKQEFNEIKPLFTFLEELAFDTIDTVVFRGHANENHRLLNSWQRHRTVPLAQGQSDVDEAIEAYKVGLEKLGIPSFDHKNRFEGLEHGRHHGLPTPCLDFTYSPYVALFFAFNEVRKPVDGSKLHSVVYALDVTHLAKFQASKRSGPLPKQDPVDNALGHFLRPTEDFFAKGFPVNALQFIPYPGKANRRMQNQMGCLLYDTMDHKSIGNKDLEEYLEKLQEIQLHEAPKAINVLDHVLYKILIDQNLVTEIFARLELMNINGARLYGDATGVALDVKNSYNYNPRFSYLRDIRISSGQE